MFFSAAFSFFFFFAQRAFSPLFLSSLSQFFVFSLPPPEKKNKLTSVTFTEERVCFEEASNELRGEMRRDAARARSSNSRSNNDAD